MRFSDELDKIKGFYIYGSFCDDFYELNDFPILVFKINKKYFENYLDELDKIFSNGNIELVYKADEE